MVIYSRSSIQNPNNWTFWTRKSNALLNLIREQDTDEPKYQLLMKKREKAGMYLDKPNPKEYTEYSNT